MTKPRLRPIGGLDDLLTWECHERLERIQAWYDGRWPERTGATDVRGAVTDTPGDTACTVSAGESDRSTKESI